MVTVFTILFVLIAVVLIAAILVQQPKTSGGLFAGTGQSLLGTSGKTFWTKTTIAMAAVFMILCIVLSILPRYETAASVTDIIDKQQQAAQAPAPAAANAKTSAPAPQGVPGAAKAAVPSEAQQAAPAPVSK